MLTTLQYIQTQGDVQMKVKNFFFARPLEINIKYGLKFTALLRQKGFI